jgi:hypothetical protein
MVTCFAPIVGKRKLVLELTQGSFSDQSSTVMTSTLRLPAIQRGARGLRESASLIKTTVGKTTWQLRKPQREAIERRAHIY